MFTTDMYYKHHNYGLYMYSVGDNTNIPREFNAESDGKVSSRKSRGRE